MKKSSVGIITLLLCSFGLAQTENISIFGGGGDNAKVILTTTDDGEVTDSIANRIGNVIARWSAITAEKVSTLKAN